MSKGQISIDLLIALLVAIIILFSLNSFVEETKLIHYTINAQTQLELEAIRITDLVTQTNLLEGTEFIFQTNLKKINYLDEKNNFLSEYPSVKIINENELSLLMQISPTKVIESKKQISKIEGTIIEVSKSAGVILIKKELS